jgi:ankyrin repeat-rich membrane spanning protein
LHVSLRNRSREITELILSNPKNSKYLYKPNKQGDTPYKIDASNPKSILTQIFGARQLNMTEDNILGYDLYSSALAEILSEPQLRTPITVGIYAKWGSGKSFLLSQLKTEMKSFAKLTRVVTLKITFSTVLSIILLNALWTFLFGLWQWAFGLALFLFFNLLMFFIIGVCKFFHDRKQKEWSERACENISRQINRFKLFLRILFLNPTKFNTVEDYEHKNLRFIFTEYGKISTLGGENALAYMISALNTKIEAELGTFITRLCRVFCHKTHSHSKFRRICCIPSFIVAIIVAFLLIVLAIFLRVQGIDFKNFKTHELAFVISLLSIILASIFGSFLTWSKIFFSIIRSPSSHILNVVQSKDKQQPYHESKVESVIFKLKKEVDYIAHTVKTIDSFTRDCTRLVIVIGKFIFLSVKKFNEFSC